MRRALVALLLAALAVAAPAAGAAPAATPAKTSGKASGKKPSTSTRVCVTKVVKKAKKGRKAVKKRVCRAKSRKKATTPKTPATKQAAGTSPVFAPRPSIPAAPAPTVGQPGTPAAQTPAAPGGSLPTTPTGEPAGPSGPVCEDDSMWLGAFAREDVAVGFRIDLSRQCIRAGRAIVRYLNTDSTHHNLYARGISPAVPAREVVGSVTPKALDADETPGQEDGTVDLTAGTWRFYCALPGHEVMARDITVTRAG